MNNHTIICRLIRTSLTRFICTAGLILAAIPAVRGADIWTLDSGEIDPTNYFGVTMANGMIGLMTAPMPFQTQQVLVNGAYEILRPGYRSSFVNSFNFLDLAFAIDGERIARPDQVTNLRQSLDMRRAVLTTTFDYQDKASVTCRLRALRQMPHTALLEIVVEAHRPIVVAPTAMINPPNERDSADYPQLLTDVVISVSPVSSYTAEEDPRARMLRQTARAKSQFGRILVGASQGFVFDKPYTEAPTVSHGNGGLTFTKHLPSGTTWSFGLVGSTLTSAHVEDPANEAQRLTTFAVTRGMRRLVELHERAWTKLWQSDILIEGDDVTQRDVHSMIYHLYSFIREGSGYSISPMGLSRGASGYLGHVFWDADTWMLPALVALQPELARTMLDYRFTRLPAARRNAANHGYRGAMFPWESAATGDEDTASTDVAGELQAHMPANVAIAAWDYYRVTQDLTWLRQTGWPLIKETADFWVSRVERNGPGRYDIMNVVAVDEYAEFVDNDAYTNGAARENLSIATAAAKLLGVTPDPKWEEVRRNIPLLSFPDGITREHSNYNGETIKQCDVNLLAYPLRQITDPATIRRNLEYYTARHDNVRGPSYSKAPYAILYHRLGETNEAMEFFRNMYVPNLRPPFRLIAESPEGRNPYFVTCAGGALQVLLYGFGGLEITDEGLVQRPTKLPADWKSLTLVRIGPDRKTYSVQRTAAH